MKRFTLSILLTGIVWGQTPLPKGGAIIKGAPAPANATPATALANVKIVKTPEGKWVCQGAGGRPCSEPERQATTTIVKSRSNVKDNMVVAPDGTIQCMSTVDKKPCTDAVFLDLGKAISKGGQQSF